MFVGLPSSSGGMPPARSTATHRVHGPAWSSSGSQSSAATDWTSHTSCAAPFVSS